MEQKTRIYYSRPYRRLQADSKKRWLFLLGIVLPSFLFLLFSYSKISHLLSYQVLEVLAGVIPKSQLGIASGEFLPLFGDLYFVQVPTTTPSHLEITINFVVTLFLLFLCLHPSRFNKGGTPITIFSGIVLGIHLIASTFFALAHSQYPYSATQYSELYMKQQIGIWLSFIVLSGLITGVLGYGPLLAG